MDTDEKIEIILGDIAGDARRGETALEEFHASEKYGLIYAVSWGEEHLITAAKAALATRLLAAIDLARESEPMPLGPWSPLVDVIDAFADELLDQIVSGNLEKRSTSPLMNAVSVCEVEATRRFRSRLVSAVRYLRDAEA